MAPALTSCCRLSSTRPISKTQPSHKALFWVVPECVIFSSAPVAFLCTRISFDFASLVNGSNAPDLAILALLSSCVARLVIHPTALHCTSTFGEFICLMRGLRPPNATMATLFSAARSQQSFLGFHIVHILLTARLPSAAQAARCTSISGFCRRNRIGSRVSRSTSLTSKVLGQLAVQSISWRRGGLPLSVISANVKLALRCKSMLSEYTNVLNARRGSPEKKSVSALWKGI